MLSPILTESPEKETQNTSQADRFLGRRDGEKWQEADLMAVAFGSNGYLMFGDIHIYCKRSEMVRKLRDAAHYLEHGASFENKPYKLPTTAADVVDYFRASPDLSYLADELEAALIVASNPQKRVKSDLSRVKEVIASEQLFEAGIPVRGAQGMIADVLGIPNAGSFRRRILSVLELLQREINSTTTPNLPEIIENRVVESVSSSSFGGGQQ